MAAPHRDVVAGRITDRTPGQPFWVTVDDREIAVVWAEGQWYAIENECPHKGGPVGAGRVRGTVITCPWHLFRFDLRTGVSVTNPRMAAQTYPVRVEGGTLIVSVPDNAEEAAHERPH